MSDVSPKVLAEYKAKLDAFFDSIAKNGSKNATFINTPEELRDAGIIDAEQADKLIAERDEAPINVAVCKVPDWAG